MQQHDSSKHWCVAHADRRAVLAFQHSHDNSDACLCSLHQFGGAQAALDAMEQQVDDQGGVSIAVLVRRVRIAPSWQHKAAATSSHRVPLFTAFRRRLTHRPPFLGDTNTQEARRAAPQSGAGVDDGGVDEAATPGARGVSRQQRKPVWTDEADARLRVNVASVNRLRKLRSAEEETRVDGAQYEERLRKQHAALHPNTSWARPKAAAEAEDGPEAALGALLTATPDALMLAAGHSRGGPAAGADALGMPLPSGELSAVRVRDGNACAPAHGVIRSVDFHWRAPLLLTAGLDKTLRLFSVDGSRNSQVSGVHFADMPIHRAAFGGDGECVLLSGRRPFFYVHHVETGASERVTGGAACGIDDKSLESFAASPQGWSGGEPLVALFADSGRIPLVSLRTRQAVGTLQMAGTARCGAFSGDGHTLLTGGSDGIVCVWDLRTRRCVDKLVDSGSTGITSLAASPAGGNFWAAGGAMGVVNVYKRSQHLRLDATGTDALSTGRTSRRATVDVASPVAAVAPQPVRSLGNLTTTVDTLAFSPDGQMLAMATRLSKDALRLVHLPSCTVFSNWPSSKTPLHYVHSCAFSPHCGYLAVGNARGRVLLYRMPHYDRL